jgi:protein TilB
MCRKIQILYLQNNIIERMENLSHLKDLRYLNLALNNIKVIEGLSACEFLNKLDLTVNFVDVDDFEASVDHLRPLLHLKDLYIMGNPAEHTWPSHRAYVAAALPQLAQLDGKEITRSERIRAQQDWRALRADLRARAAAAREAKGLPKAPEPPRDDPDDDSEPWCPETRTKMYREMAEQKEEQEARKRQNEPRKRDAAAEHAARAAAVRQAEAEGIIRQTNEGRWDFVLEDEWTSPNVCLRLSLSRFLDSSLISVDTHPLYISIVIRNKTFRILWPEEVRSSEGTCQRSATTGELCVTVPRVRQRGAGGAAGDDDAGGAARAARWATVQETKAKSRAANDASRTRRLAPEGSAVALADALRNEAKTVSIAGIARGGATAASAPEKDTVGDGLGGSSLFRQVSSTSKAVNNAPAPQALSQDSVDGKSETPNQYEDDDDVPPLEDAR